MIKNARIRIKECPELCKMKLKDLVGRQGTVTEDLSENRIKYKGGLVMLDEPYLDESLWFIPEEAVVYE